jgi:hypothetical protein
MDDQLDQFAEWLRGCAASAGYDPNSRGGIAALAKAAGTDRGQTGRALRGEVKPAISSQRAWSRVLKIPLREMLVRSGTLEADDLPQPGDQPPPPTTEIDLYQIARKFGIAEDRAHLFVASVEAVANTFADEQKGTTIAQSQTGGLSAKR